VFDGLVTIRADVLGPRNGSVGVDLLEPAHLRKWTRTKAHELYFAGVYKRRVFAWPGKPSVVITITRD
jgi:hypothetical protein